MGPELINTYYRNQIKVILFNILKVRDLITMKSMSCSITLEMMDSRNDEYREYYFSFMLTINTQYLICN